MFGSMPSSVPGALLVVSGALAQQREIEKLRPATQDVAYPVQNHAFHVPGG